MEHIVAVIVRCPSCKIDMEVPAKGPDLYKWINRGTLAQSAFPYLQPDLREMLLSGLCGACFDSMFPKEM